MKKISSFALICLALIAVMLASCKETETYADKKNRERDAINQFIAENGIRVISESQFKSQDSTTNVANNEYVLFENTGVYMQIVRKGTGEKLAHGKGSEMLVRFKEWNILGDSLQMSNCNQTYAYFPDVMTVYNSYGVFTGSFISGLMASAHGTYVPPGWLVPFTYIKIGRQSSPDEEIAHVKLIVPSDQGHESASAYVCPYHYELYIQHN